MSEPVHCPRRPSCCWKTGRTGCPACCRWLRHRGPGRIHGLVLRQRLVSCLGGRLRVLSDRYEWRLHWGGGGLRSPDEQLRQEVARLRRDDGHAANLCLAVVTRGRRRRATEGGNKKKERATHSYRYNKLGAAVQT
jgi:hypothetical protein